MRAPAIAALAVARLKFKHVIRRSRRILVTRMQMRLHVRMSTLRSRRRVGVHDEL